MRNSILKRHKAIEPPRRQERQAMQVQKQMQSHFAISLLRSLWLDFLGALGVLAVQLLF